MVSRRMRFELEFAQFGHELGEQGFGQGEQKVVHSALASESTVWTKLARNVVKWFEVWPAKVWPHWQ